MKKAETSKATRFQRRIVQGLSLKTNAKKRIKFPDNLVLTCKSKASQFPFFQTIAARC